MIYLKGMEMYEFYKMTADSQIIIRKKINFKK